MSGLYECFGETLHRRHWAFSDRCFVRFIKIAGCAFAKVKFEFTNFFEGFIFNNYIIFHTGKNKSVFGHEIHLSVPLAIFVASASTAFCCSSERSSKIWCSKHCSPSCKVRHPQISQFSYFSCMIISIKEGIYKDL